MSPADAALLLESTYVSDPKAWIADKLRDGLIRARAAEMWRSEDQNIDDAWENRATAEIEIDVLVDRKVWRRTRHPDYDVSNSRWPEGRFFVTRSKETPGDITILIGVEFHRGDILNYIEKVASISPISKNSGGKPSDMDRWASYWHCIIKIAKEQRLNKGDFSSQQQLRNEIREMMGNGAFSDENIIMRTRQVWKKFVDSDDTSE
jgi:hypothetical protein